MVNKKIEFIEICEASIGFSGQLIKKYNELKPTPNTAQQVMMFLIAKSRISANALLLLLKNGYKYDAQVILRSIFENILNTEYIFRQSDQNKSAERYIEYEIPSTLKYANKYLIHGKDKSQFPQIELRKKELEGELLLLKKKHGKNFGKTSHWSGESIKDVARKCEMEKYYEILYSLWSDFHHANIQSSRAYTEKVSGGFRVVEKRDYNCVPEVIALIDFFLRINDRLNNEFILGENEELENIKNKYLELNK